MPVTKSVLIVLSLTLAAAALKGPLTKERLTAAAREGGDYLVRMQKADGSFHYYYDAQRDLILPRTYNMVRHAGTAMSLLDLYAATRDVRYLESARRAVEFLKTRFRSARTGKALYVLDYDGKAKLGANGLALVAITKLIELDPNASAHREIAMQLANLILAMQRKDGSYETRYRLRSTDPDGPASLYYPGEATLGLIRLFKLNRDERLLNSARRAADFLIKSQNAMPVLPPDAWLMQALEALHSVTNDKRFAYHAIALAEAMIEDQYKASDPPTLAGGFGPGPPRATPAAARAEGLVSAYRIARSINDGRASKIAGSLSACGQFQLTQQFTAQNSKSLPNAQRARGGFREGLTSSRVRIDFVQHNISSLVGIAEALY